MNEASLPAGGSDIAGAASPGAVSRTVETLLSRIARHEERLSAFTRVMADEARRQAAVLDALDPAERGPLHGMVVSIKDIIDVEGVATTCGSRSRLDRVAERDATLVARLRHAGAVVIGKANCHEFAFGGPAFDLPFPPARNPWDDELFPGGSSSGSGVSVAAGFCHASIGSDTAGSIRLPSSHCGIVGLKIGNGRVPLDGMCALSPSLDSVGPMALSVADCAAIYDVIADGDGGAAGAEEAAVLGACQPDREALVGCRAHGTLDVIGQQVGCLDLGRSHEMIDSAIAGCCGGNEQYSPHEREAPQGAEEAGGRGFGRARGHGRDVVQGRLHRQEESESVENAAMRTPWSFARRRTFPLRGLAPFAEIAAVGGAAPGTCGCGAAFPRQPRCATYTLRAHRQ